ncbi:MAG: hypothetical protein K2I00_02720 [Ruminococcus sp.]|nr:hypothetical protein [Ruminococcus sp.]
MGNINYGQKMNAISSLFCCDDMEMRQMLFRSQAYYLHNVRFVFFDYKGSNIDSTFDAIPLQGHEDDYEKFHLYGLGDYTQALLIDCKHAMPGILSAYSASKTAHLDLNILSDIYHLLANKNIRIDTECFKNYLNYLKKNQFSMDAQHATLERVATLTHSDELEFKETIKYFCLFQKMPIGVFSPNSVSLTNEETIVIENFINERLQCKTSNFQKYCAICCLIDKAYLLKKDKSIKSKKQRVEELVKYAIYELTCNMENELYLLSKYLLDEQSVVPFFHKLNKKTNIIKNIRNTAWDMFQLRLLEEDMATNNCTDFNKLHFPFFATHDQGLSMVIEMNPIRCIALYENKCIPFHKYSLQDTLKSYTYIVRSALFQQDRDEKALNTDYEKIRKALEDSITASV